MEGEFSAYIGYEMKGSSEERGTKETTERDRGESRKEREGGEGEGKNTRKMCTKQKRV